MMDVYPVSADSKIQFLSEHGQGPFDFWFAQTARMFDIAPILSGRNSGQFEIHNHTSESCVIVSATYDAQSLRMTKRHSSLLRDLVQVQRFVRGGTIGVSGDNAFAHRPGDIAIIDYAHQFDALHEASHLESVYLNKDSLGLPAEAPLPSLHFRAGTLAARLLGREMDRLCMPLNSGASELNASDFSRFVSCVKFAIVGNPVGGDVRRQARNALRDLICEHIERNLLSPDLSTTSILREFGVSRASLYRMFESENGVRNYISNRRLFRAVFEISSKPIKRGMIHEAAERWGFSSDANFSRSVRRAFGTTPGQLCSYSLSDLDPSAMIPNSERAIEHLTGVRGFEKIAA